MHSASHTPVLRMLGHAAYVPTFDAMRAFTDARTADTPDEFWVVEHPPVFTLGIGADPSHVLTPHEIPVVQTDRGGEVTYHGPGQAVIYLLLDLPRRKLMVRQLVRLMEQALIEQLADWGITAERREAAPGVYVGATKIAALGLKITRGCSYHGLSLNVDMDLAPFGLINPCGYEGLVCSQLKDFGFTLGVDAVLAQLAARIEALLDEQFPLMAAQ